MKVGVGGQLHVLGALVVRFCWLKLVCGVDGKMKMVKCKVCFVVEGREKFLMPKIDYLVKHFEVKRCIVVKPKVVIKQQYVCKTNAQVKNEHLFSSTWLDSAFAQL
jgi:hypothetical protein